VHAINASKLSGDNFIDDLPMIDATTSHFESIKQSHKVTDTISTDKIRATVSLLIALNLNSLFK
jgi:hypothetical protein